MLFTIIPGPLSRRGNGSPPAPYNFTRRVLGYSGYSYFYTKWLSASLSDKNSNSFYAALQYTF